MEFKFDPIHIPIDAHMLAELEQGSLEIKEHFNKLMLEAAIKYAAHAEEEFSEDDLMDFVFDWMLSDD